MRLWRAETTACLLGSALLLFSPSIVSQANATELEQVAAAAAVTRPISTTIATFHDNRAYRVPSRDYRSIAHGGHFSDRSVISCVPYARQISGIMVTGNAWQWWDHAAGAYARGHIPEAGSVLTFRSNDRMHLGHVAVVNHVVNAREVIVDHANWPSTRMRGAISHNVAVVDVSEANNWSAVRVQLIKSTEFGSIYPTYGFIYNRPDNGIMTASIDPPAPLPAINQVPSDLRPVPQRPWRTVEEVAESPVHAPRQIDLRVAPAVATP